MLCGQTTKKMRTEFYLVVNESGSIRTCKTQPNLKFNEVSVALTIDLPDNLFKKPMLSGVIEVPDSKVRPTVITPEITQDIQNAIKDHSGVEVRLEIQEPEHGI